MIAQTSIDEVRQKADLLEVVGTYTKLKRSGRSFSGCCPFHQEKTPSFHVTPTKGIYKCFGCGKSGDVFRIVMEQERKTFWEAVEHLAGKYNVQLQTDRKEVPPEQKEAKQQQQELLQWAAGQYHQQLLSLPPDAPAVQYLQSRGYTRERILHWNLGFAPDVWDFVKTPIINMGRHQAGVDCGLISSKEGKNWDFFRGRIIIPITDANGYVVALGGRSLPGEDKGPKYLNSCESLVYQKRKVLYGLHTAAKAIHEKSFAYLVEGYMDVQSMQDHGMENTVAPCGTSVDDAQIRLLKRHTDHVVLCFDGDSPGLDKMSKLIPRFLEFGFKVSCAPLPDKMDPDEYIRNLKPQTV